MALLRSIDRSAPAVLEFYEEDSEKGALLAKCRNKIDELREKLEIDTHQDNLLQWVELLGSLAYISRTMLPGENFEAVNKKIGQLKSEYYNRNMNYKAWELLNKAQLLSISTMH